MPDETLTLSVPETARALGVGMCSVYRAIREGRMPALKIGPKRKFRIPKRAIDRLMDNPALWQGGGE